MTAGLTIYRLAKGGECCGFSTQQLDWGMHLHDDFVERVYGSGEERLEVVLILFELSL